MVLSRHPDLPEGQYADIAFPRNGWEPLSEDELATIEAEREAQRAARITAPQPAPAKKTAAKKTAQRAAGSDEPTTSKE